MWNAALWGGISGSAVLLGAISALLFPIKTRVIGGIMAFGTGVLLGAATYELLGDSAAEGGIMPAAIGFLLGAGVFTIFDIFISRRGADKRKRSHRSISGQEAGMAIFIGTVIDAIPESIMIGGSLIGGKSVSLLLVAAIFISNFPEGLSSTSGLMKSGYTKMKIMLLWMTVLIISMLCAMGGYMFLSDASDAVVAMIAAFAGGGIIAMVGSTMMPEAFEEGGPITGFIAALGLLASLVLQHLSP